MDLVDLKKEYRGFSKKYELPSVEDLNDNFEVDKIDKESDTLLRVFRKVMMEKIISSLGFVEMFFNPMNAPRMYLNYIKSMSAEDKKSIEKIHSVFSEVSLAALGREVDYSEEKEAELIKKIFESWNSVKSDFRKILKNMKNPVENSTNKNRSYFG